MEDEAKDKMWKMLEALEHVELTEWEEKFIESIRIFYLERRRLTPRQMEVLEKIHNERT